MPEIGMGFALIRRSVFDRLAERARSTSAKIEHTPYGGITSRAALTRRRGRLFV